MRTPWLFAFILLLPLYAHAQVEEGVRGEQGEAQEDEDFRDVSGYLFPPLSRTVRDMQNIAYAFNLRDYCADNRIPDAFVRERLARFSQITGRKETCRSLRNY